MSFRSTLSACLVPVVFAALHCHSHDDEGTPASLGDVLFAEGATDEGLEALLAASPKAGDKRARFTSPKVGDKLTGPPTFTWSFEAPTGSLPLPSFDPLAAPGVAPRMRPRAWDIPRAHAHGAPMSGTGYFLVVSTQSDPKLLRLFTKATSFTPDAAAWERIKSSSGEVRAVVTTALFENNKILEGGGPFEGEPITLDVAR